MALAEKTNWVRRQFTSTMDYQHSPSSYVEPTIPHIATHFLRSSRFNSSPFSGQADSEYRAPLPASQKSSKSRSKARSSCSAILPYSSSSDSDASLHELTLHSVLEFLHTIVTSRPVFRHLSSLPEACSVRGFRGIVARRDKFPEKRRLLKHWLRR
jgi:hypothetical protein